MMMPPQPGPDLVVIQAQPPLLSSSVNLSRRCITKNGSTLPWETDRQPSLSGCWGHDFVLRWLSHIRALPQLPCSGRRDVFEVNCQILCIILPLIRS
jgi:hypothetical protein